MLVALLAALAGALSSGDPVSAMAVFDRGMADYQTIESNIGALTAQDDVLCSIDIVEEKDGTLDTDWYLELKSKSDNAQSERRRERVRIEAKQVGGKWKIVSMKPLSVLDPVTVH